MWLYLAGRGTGKTRSAAEWLSWRAIRRPKTRWLVSAPTFGDVRDVCAEGESGLIRVLSEYDMLEKYDRSLGDIYLRNGSRVKLISGEKPARFRGPQFHGGWLDELATFQRPEAFEQARIIMRLPGDKPQIVVTTTPRPVPVIRKLIDAERVIVSRGKTIDNAANLSEGYLDNLDQAFGGTRLWRQEMLGEMLEDVPGALWTPEIILREIAPDEFKRKVVAIDPAVTNTETSDETGIVVAGKCLDNRLCVLADYSCKDSVAGWARRAIEAYKMHECDAIVYEDNQGGDAIREVLLSIDPYAPVRSVRATVGKRLRAEPIAALYEQGKVFHARQYDYNAREVWPLSKLEDQMMSWASDNPHSPDRLDALVHALTELAGVKSGSRFLLEISTICERCQMPNDKSAVTCNSCHAPLASTTSISQWASVKGLERG